MIATEESGDRLGAALMRALAARTNEQMSFAGVGGHEMERAGIRSLFPIDELAIIGIDAVIAKLPMILRRIRETAAAVTAAKPDVLVIIDSPDFTHRVARSVRAARAAYPDRRLCVAVGLGLAAGARARHAPLCRSRAGACCRSSRRRTSGSAGRHVLMSAIR